MSSPFTRLRALLGVLAMILGLAVVVSAPAFAATGVTDVWTGGDPDSNAWTSGLNWSTGHAPANGDSVYIAPPSAGQCYAHVTDVPSGVMLQAFTMTEASPQAGFTCLASVDGGSISVAGAFSVHSGVVGTAFTLLPGSTGTISPFTGFSDDSTFDSDLTVHGTLTLDGNVPDSDDHSRDVVFDDGSSLTVASDGVLDAVDGNVFTSDACCVTPAHLVNDGVVHVQGQTLTVTAAELDQDGQLDTPNAGRLITASAPQTAADGATYTGTGSWLNSTGSATTLTGTQTLAPTFQLILGGNGSGGDENLYGKATLAGTGTFVWAGGTIAANLTIAHGLKAVASGNPPASRDDDRQLSGSDGTNPLAVTNHGTFTFSNGAAYYAVSGGTIYNESDGVLSLNPGTSIGSDCCGSPGVIANHGGKVSVPNTSVTTPVVLDNTSFQQTGGSTTIPASHQVQLTGGATSAFSSALVGGGGLLLIASPATVTKLLNTGANTTVQLADHGSLTATSTAVATVGGAGAFSWTGGAIAGNLSLAAAGGTTVSGTVHKTLDEFNDGPSNVTITSPTTTIAAGTTANPDELDLVDDSRLTLAGTTTVASDVIFSHGHVVNTGTLTVRGSAAHPVSVSAADVTNRGTATISGVLKVDNNYLQVAGTTNILRGAVLNIVGSSSLARISGGVLGGLGQVTGSVSNSAGQLQPGVTQIGTLTITGNYNQFAAASARFKIGASTGDLVSVGGTAVVRGSLAFVNTGFTPAAGAVRTVLTAGSRPNVVASCTTTTGPGSTTQHWTPSVSGTSLMITSVAGAQTSC